MRRHLVGALATVVATLALSACGGSAHSTCCDATGMAGQSVSLMLDFTPNAIHVGIYDALAHHFDAVGRQVEATRSRCGQRLALW